MPNPSSQDIVQFLLTPQAFPGQSQTAELRQTHISWVFLTAADAYKLKKPVRHDFLDFSTADQRRQACENEVRLNRRLAGDVYRGVLPVTLDSQGDLAVGGRGNAVDWLVHMRRLPDRQMLDALIRDQRLTNHDVLRVAQFLSAAYARLSPLPINASEYRREIEAHVRNNRRELLRSEHGLPPALVKRVHAAQLQLLLLHPEVFNARVAAGRIVEGHGDLRPEHICLEEKIVIFDCIEFNAELRQIDIADELAFLAVECQMLGAPDLGQRVLDAYRQHTGDEPPRQLWAFYQAYRACVRAKVAALRAVQLPANGREEVLGLAKRYLDLADPSVPSIAPPRLLIVRGLMGTGKSTLATCLTQTLGIELLQTDAVRRELLGVSSGTPEYGQGNYRPELREQVYRELLRRAEVLLGDRHSVVLDGTFLSSQSRRDAIELAARHGAAASIVQCLCPADVALERIKQRMAAGEGVSEARPDLFAAQQAEEEADPPGGTAVKVDTTRSLEEQLPAVLSALTRDDQG